MIKKFLLFIICLAILSNSGFAYAIAYEDFKNAFSLYRWSNLDKLVREKDPNANTDPEVCSIKVDEDSIKNYINTNLLGVHLASDKYYDYKYHTVRESYEKVAGDIYKVPIFRMGSTGNAVNALKMREDRQISYILEDIGYEDYEPEIVYEESGVEVADAPQLPEKILAALKNNPDAKFILTVDIKRTYPEETVELLHFCTDANGTSKWAKLREDWGIEKPIEVLGLEMGNELYFMNSSYWVDEEQMATAVNWYIETSIKHAEAIETDFPDVKIIPCVDGKADRSGFLAWNEPVITRLAPYIDCVAVHQYNTMHDVINTTNPSFEPIKQIIQTTNKDIKIALTEFSTWDSDSASGKLHIKRQSLAAMLDVMKFMCSILPQKEFYCANYHNFIDETGWGMYRAGNGTNGEPVPSSIGKAFTMLYDNYGDKVLEHTVTSGSGYTDMTNGYNKLACVVMGKGEDTLKVMLVNDSMTKSFNVSFEFNKEYTLTKTSMITAPNDFSHIYGKGASDLFEAENTTFSDNNTFTQYTIPSNSFVILTLEAK